MHYNNIRTWFGLCVFLCWVLMNEAGLANIVHVQTQTYSYTCTNTKRLTSSELDSLGSHVRKSTSSSIMVIETRNIYIDNSECPNPFKVNIISNEYIRLFPRI